MDLSRLLFDTLRRIAVFRESRFSEETDRADDREFLNRRVIGFG